MTNIVFVSSGLQSPKKGDAAIFKRQRYLNYGLLSLANSTCAPRGSVFHGHFDPPSHTAQCIADAVDKNDRTVCFLSCPSFLSLRWAKEFVEEAAERLSDIKFILGGRWVVDGNIEIIKRLMPRCDAVFEGVGEGKLSDFLSERFAIKYERDKDARTIFDEAQLSYLDYSKLSEPEAFVPSFEGSRGCGAGCMFCVEAAVKLTKLKDPAVLCEEIMRYTRTVSHGVHRFYLETSNFTPRLDWIDDFISRRNECGLGEVTWRTESRVDMFSQRSIEKLALAGLKVLDLGLESASPQQLIGMGKTKDPKAYLERCSRLIRTAADSGVLVKLNVLLFPGESHATIAHTTEWLEENRRYFVGISAFPTVYYGFNPNGDPLVARYCELGAKLVGRTNVDGIYSIHLSREIPHPESESLARMISRRFMSARQYFALKSFSYFDP